jgi:ribosome-binding protein aMBF1 (putative translation factor)
MAGIAKAARKLLATSWSAAVSARQSRSPSPPATQDAYKAERTRLLRAFGERLRAERERRNLSQEALARVANIHRTQLGALELGQRDPHLTMLLVLADGLGITPGRLLEGLFVPRERKAATHHKGRLGG